MIDETKYNPPEGFSPATDEYGNLRYIDRMPILTDSKGATWVDVQGTLVKFVPRPEELAGFAVVCRGLLRRLENAVESGIKVRGKITKIGTALEERKRQFNQAQTEEEKRAWGAKVAGAYLSEFVVAVEEVLTSLETHGRLPENDNMTGSMIELRKFAKYVRLRDGSKDNDAIIQEAIGEGPFAVAGTFTAYNEGVENGRNALTVLYGNRYKKIAVAKKEIDRIEREMLDTASPNEELENVARRNTGQGLEDVRKMIGEISAAAKELLETPYTDTAEFDRASVKFDVAKDRLKKACVERSDIDHIEKDTFRHVMEGVNLMSGMITYRLSMPVSTTGFMAIRAIGKLSTQILYMIRDANGQRKTEEEELVVLFDEAAKDLIKEEFHDNKRESVGKDFETRLVELRDKFLEPAYSDKRVKIAEFILNTYIPFVRNLADAFKDVTGVDGKQSVNKNIISDYREMLEKQMADNMKKIGEMRGNVGRGQPG